MKWWLYFLFWVGFLYIWGLSGWQDAELFNKVWWFDTAGHALFGIAFAWMLLLIISGHAVKGAFLFTGKIFLSIVVIAGVMLVGILWEAAERLWDWYLQPNYFMWLAKAQKDSVDTVSDILVNFCSAFFFVTCYHIYNIIYEKWHPDEAEKTEIEETIEMIQYVSEKIRRRRREHLPKLKPALQNLFQSIKGSRNKNTP